MRREKRKRHDVERFSVLFLLFASASLVLSAGCASVPTRPAAEIRVDHRPTRPHPHARWVEGHWTYQQGRYHWVRGSWAR